MSHGLELPGASQTACATGGYNSCSILGSVSQDIRLVGCVLVVCCCSSSALRLDMLCVLRCSSALHSYLSAPVSVSILLWPHSIYRYFVALEFHTQYWRACACSCSYKLYKFGCGDGYLTVCKVCYMIGIHEPHREMFLHLKLFLKTTLNVKLEVYSFTSLPLRRLTLIVLAANGGSYSEQWKAWLFWCNQQNFIKLEKAWIRVQSSSWGWLLFGCIHLGPM